MTVKIITGDCRDVLKTLPSESVHCCITSPPYFGLRDYGVGGQMGLESSPEEFISGMVDVFREVRRVLRDDGTLWLNIGDSYAGSWGAQSRGNETGECKATITGSSPLSARQIKAHPHTTLTGNRGVGNGVKPKDLIGIPWMLAFALRVDGWYLRQDIIWAKPNPMPESVRDRCTKSHEYIFLLTKSARYFYDAEAIKEQASSAEEYVYAGDDSGIHSGESHAGSGKSTRRFAKGIGGWAGGGSDRSALAHNVKGRTTHGEKVKALMVGRSGNTARKAASERGVPVDTDGSTNGAVAGSVPWEGILRNKRSVWPIPTQPFKEAHFATFPPDLVVPCILAGTSAAGCCASCGAPIVRHTDREFIAQDDTSEETGVRGSGEQKPMDASNGWEGVPRGFTASRTTGWLPSCDCLDHRSVPCTVLDPFGGAGTTGLVADRLQRDAVLLELNPEYAEMAARRINGEGKLFAAASIVGRESVEVVA